MKNSPDHRALIPYLKPGDRIGLAASARKVSREEMAPAIAFFRNHGLEVVEASNLYMACNQFAGTDTERARGLQELLDDPSVKAIVFARGGYGTARIIDLLDFTAFLKHPKWITGFSDLTALHSHIERHFGLPTLHSPMAISMQAHNNDAESMESMKKALFGEALSYHVPPHAMNKPGTANAAITGGNLSVIFSTIGSVSDVDIKGKILFLEDLDEYLYHIDRMMVNLKRTGKLTGIKGLIVGGMGDMKDNTIPFGQTAYEIIAEHVAQYDYPVCYGFPAGHDRKNLPIFFGTTAQLEVNENSVSLSFAGM